MLYADITQNSLARQSMVSALRCDLCRCEIYPGEAYYLLSCRTVCRRCLEHCRPEPVLPQRRFAPDPEVDS